MATMSTIAMVPSADGSSDGGGGSSGNIVILDL